MEIVDPPLQALCFQVAEEMTIEQNALSPPPTLAAPSLFRLQVEKLKRLRETRDQSAVDSALAKLTEGAKGGENLLALSIEAARVRCTLGEISDALESVSGLGGASRKRFSSRSPHPHSSPAPCFHLNRCLVAIRPTSVP